MRSPMRGVLRGDGASRSARTEPLTAEHTRFLAEWAAAAPQGPSLQRFCVNALRQLWLTSDGGISPDDYAATWREQFGGTPAAAGGDRAIRRNERLMKLRGPYDTPAAWVHGQWFFAHDRLVQIGERLDHLGWTVA